MAFLDKNSNEQPAEQLSRRGSTVGKDSASAKVSGTSWIAPAAGTQPCHGVILLSCQEPADVSGHSWVEMWV